MKKSTFITIAGLVALILTLVGLKGMQFGFMAKQGAAFKPPPIVVTSATAAQTVWESTLTAVGSLKAVEGVTVAAELSGKITRIAFTPGSSVKKGDLLLQQDVSTEQAQLRAAQASARLAENNLKRSKRLIAKNGISKSELDSAQAAYAEAVAQVNNSESLIAKKTIRAPFSGHLGVKLVNVGQHLATGETIVSLQKINPIFVNFYLPQRYLKEIQMGLVVRASTEDLSGIELLGKVTAFNPEVDSQTRNILVQATLDNTEQRLLPGMFVESTLVLPEEKTVLVIPISAVAYAPYGNSVFVIEQEQSEDGTQTEKLRQQFIRLGETRGDFVAIESGIEVGQRVVSTGVFKLSNGAHVQVNNEQAPDFARMPQPDNS